MNDVRPAALAALTIAVLAIGLALLGAVRADDGLIALGAVLLAGSAAWRRWLPARSGATVEAVPDRQAGPAPAGAATAPTPTVTTAPASHAATLPADPVGGAPDTAQAAAETPAWRARVRSLERILAASNRLNATHDRGELADRVVATVAELGGFRRVHLGLWDDAVHAFVARASTGYAPAEVTALTAAAIPLGTFADWTSPAHRYSNCFLVPAGAGEVAATAAASLAGPWPAGLRLVAPLVAASGERYGFLSLAEPVSGSVPDPETIRLLEFLVQQAATALESAEIYDRLAARNAELAAASRKLDSLAKMKRNFVANVSHELRTPLTSISAYSELLQSGLDRVSGDALAEFLRVIHSESQRLTGIVNDILEVGSMEKGRGALQTVDVDLAQLARRRAEGWSSQAAAASLALTVATPDQPVRLGADPVLLQQLLDHLVANAVKFTPPGGEVRVTVSETGTAARLTVEDTGIGIPDDKLGEIFQSFFQVDGSATRAHNGQGVGLAICHDIVQHHDGRIWAENRATRGARFTVLLPRRAPVVQGHGPEQPGSASLESGEFLQRLLHWVAGTVGVQTAALMMPDADDLALTIRAAIGLPEPVVQGTRLRRGAGYAGRVWESARTLLLSDVTTALDVPRDASEPRYSTPSLLCVPLLDDGRCTGVLTVNNKSDGLPLDDDDRLLLEALAPRVAALLSRHTAWQRDGQALHQVRHALRATTAVGQACGENIYGICREICLATARRVPLEPADLSALAFALPYYDVGLSRVPPQLLGRPGRLDEAEERIVQGHVAAGLEILAPLALDPRVRRIIRHHHENVDGTGYPEGLVGEAIPPGARLLRLTDTLAALLSRRPWRGAWSLADALTELRDHAGSRYCARLVPLFLREVEARRGRILALQDGAGDSDELRRPLLDREGMVSIRD
jgi:signal transduction histidine kinase